MKRYWFNILMLFYLLSPLLSYRVVSSESETGIFNSGPVWSPDGKYIAFASGDGVDANVWIVNLTNYEFTNLTEGRATLDFDPQWSPDSKYLTYRGGLGNDFDVFLTAIDSKTPINLTKDYPFINAENRWSPNGQYLAINISPTLLGSELVLVDVNTLEITKLSSEIDLGFHHLAWLSDNQHIAFIGIADNFQFNGIWILNIETQQVAKLSDEFNYINIVGSPDRKFLAAAATHNGEIDIIVIDMENGIAKNITADIFSSDILAAWSPDSEKLVFSSRRSGHSDIWVINRDGSDALNLTNTPDRDLYPSWSPDGSMIAYEAVREDGSDIWIMNADGSNPINLTENME